MNLYIIPDDLKLSNESIKYLLDRLTPYSNVTYTNYIYINKNITTITSGYLDRLTIGKLKHQLLNNDVRYYVAHDEANIIYYLCQTKQIIIPEEHFYHICKDKAYNSLKTLIELGANINYENNHQWTALHAACYWNRPKFTELLLKVGANIDALNSDGWTPLHYACTYDNVESVKLLVERGANINLKDGIDRTPLQIAKQFNHVECINLLNT